jgi:hypothetical protein
MRLGKREEILDSDESDRFSLLFKKTRGFKPPVYNKQPPMKYCRLVMFPQFQTRDLVTMDFIRTISKT